MITALNSRQTLATSHSRIKLTPIQLVYCNYQRVLLITVINELDFPTFYYIPFMV